MEKAIPIVFLLFLLNSQLYSQKKNLNKYKEGYIIRLSDTIQCKIYAGYQDNEIGHEVTFRYNDGRILTYHPGGVIKGFGIKSDTGLIHFYQIKVPEYWIKEQTNSKAFAEVVTSGQLTLYKYTKIKHSIWVLPAINQPGVIMSQSFKRDRKYFIKKAEDDSLYEVGHKNLIGPEYFEREEIISFLKDYPQAIANVGDEFIYIKDLKKILGFYNNWYKRKSVDINKENHD